MNVYRRATYLSGGIKIVDSWNSTVGDTWFPINAIVYDKNDNRDYQVNILTM